MSYYRSSAAFAAIMAEHRPSIALVTGGKSGIGTAMAIQIASFPFIETVLAVSRSISDQDVAGNSKIQALAADIGTKQGRQTIVEQVDRLCNSGDKKQLRYLIHSAGTIEPIKPVLQVTPEELRNTP